MPPSALLHRLDELIAYFNRRVMDVPDGLFDRNARFTLNGVAFEAILGRGDDDPLIRMIARGAAGYRFAAKPLLHALETVLVSRMEFEEEGTRARGHVALRGMLRGSRTVLDETVSLDLALTGNGSVSRADVLISDTALDKIRAARSS
jgi:hypothetical protein